MREAGSALIEQVSAPESLSRSSNNAVLRGPERPLLALNCRKELARFSNTFLRPWHNSSQAPYLFDDRASELSTAGSARKVSFSVVASAGVATAGVSAAAVAGAGGAVGAKAERGCGASGFAATESSKDCDAGFGFRARFTDEFNQNEILAVPS